MKFGPQYRARDARDNRYNPRAIQAEESNPLE